MSETHTPEIPATNEEIAGFYAAHIQIVHREIDPPNCMVCAMCDRIEADRATIAKLRETNSRLNRRVTKAEGVVLSKARHELAAGRSLGRALANAACSALRAQNAELLAALERLDASERARDSMHTPDGDDIARMMEYAAAWDNARAVIQKAKESR